MSCPKCIDYIGKCGACGADLRKGTASEPIGRPVLPPRRPRRDGDGHRGAEYADDNPEDEGVSRR